MESAILKLAPVIKCSVTQCSWPSAVSFDKLSDHVIYAHPPDQQRHITNCSCFWNPAMCAHTSVSTCGVLLTRLHCVFMLFDCISPGRRCGESPTREARIAVTRERVGITLADISIISQPAVSAVARICGHPHRGVFRTTFPLLIWFYFNRCLYDRQHDRDSSKI